MRVHLVDGTFELYRAHFSRRPGHERDGVDFKATVGFAASMLALLHDESEAVSHVAVAFDNPIRSIRNDWYDGYKTDEGVPPELRSQFGAVEEAARALGIVVWSMDRWEADDALATGAARWRDQVDQVRILTPDKDLGQCVVGTRVVLVDRIRQQVIDEPELRRRRGIAPQQMPDFLALVGDAADGYPGVPGFGEKTATALLQAFSRIEDIPRDPSKWPPQVRSAPRLAQVLSVEMDRAMLYRKLATLIVDVPLPGELEDLRWGGVPRARFESWCESLDATGLRERPTRWIMHGT
jgi:5'-3' exonuclease